VSGTPVTPPVLADRSTTPIESGDVQLGIGAGPKNCLGYESSMKRPATWPTWLTGPRVVHRAMCGATSISYVGRSMLH